MSVHSVRFIVAPNSFPVMPDQIGHLPSAKVVIIIEKRCRSIAFVAQSQTSNLSIPTAQARLQGLQADPRRLADTLAAHKSPCKTSASTAVRRLALIFLKSLHKSRFAKLLEKSESEDFSMIIDNQHITRRKSYAFSHSAKLLYTNFVKEDNRNLRG